MRRALFPLAGAALAACIATAPEGIRRQTDQGDGAGGIGFATTSSSAGTTIGTGSVNKDPHQVLGAVPPAGPFSGGQLVIVHGKGFEPGARVWFDDVEAAEVVAIDPTRLQVNAPPHDPGVVPISVQNGDDASTLRSLDQAYTYQALYADPDTGPVSGGTVITIHGKGTEWDGGGSVEALIDQKPCTTLDVLGPEALRCTVPKGTPGAKSISVVTTSQTLAVLDAYTYQDSDDGFKGGLAGAPLGGTLKVLVFDNYTGDPIPGAHVIVGSDIQSGLYQQADASGLALFVDESLNMPVTVTVAAKCHSPISFVDVPVDSVTTYLDPTLTPQCAGDGDPPPVGGNPVQSGQIKGELVWDTGQEFQKGPWVNVPAVSGPNEERVAFVFFATSDPTRFFATMSLSYAVYESSPGDFGYGFSVPAYPGNHAMYALAGIRDTQSNVFSAYAFGAVQGVAALPGKYTEHVVIPMKHSLDQALVLDAKPPTSGQKGPDRLLATVAVEIATNRFAILPGMQKTPLIPLPGSVTFVGLPPLDKNLVGSRYIAGAEAVTGASLAAPLSVVGRVATTTTSQPVLIDGFVSVPQLVTPVPGTQWDGKHLAVDFVSGGFPVDLSVYEITAGGGLARWLVAVPKGSHAIELPSLAGLPDAGLPAGPINVGVYGARIDGFDYGKLGYRNLRPVGMNAYSLDVFTSYL